MTGMMPVFGGDELDLATCPDCGCPIELSWRDAWRHELRDAHGRWTRGASPAVPGDDWNPDPKITKAILDAWHGADNVSVKEALNQAGASWSAGDHSGTISLLRDAAMFAANAGQPDKADSYRVIAGRIATADAEANSMEAPATRMAEKAAPEVSRMLGGGRSAWNHRLYTWGDDDLARYGVAAQVDWDGSIGMQAQLANDIRKTEHGRGVIPNPVAYQDLLHEMIHANISTDHPYRASMGAYQQPGVKAIEEGFTELGAHHHAEEFFKTIGIANRPSGQLAVDEHGGPIPNPAYKRGAARLAADLQKQWVKLAFDDRAPYSQAAGHLANVIQDLKHYPEEAVFGGDAYTALGEVQHLGDPELATWARHMAKRVDALSEISVSKPMTLGELARTYNDHTMIATGNGWGHYTNQTAEAQRWTEDLAHDEGFSDFGPGTPGQKRAIELANEVNRNSPAAKPGVMAWQAMMALNVRVKDEYRDEFLYELGHWISDHWAAGLAADAEDKGLDIAARGVEYLTGQHPDWEKR
jgi:hypothetical protein